VAKCRLTIVCRKYSFTANGSLYHWNPHDSYFAVRRYSLLFRLLRRREQLYRGSTRVGKMEFKSKNSTLLIDNDVLPALNTVIVTLMYVWGKERRSKDEDEDEQGPDNDCCTSHGDADCRDCCGCFGD